MSVGLFDYPVLMAADILAYDTDRVPVGDDQRQHLELARDVAIRFNHRFGDTLVVPEATIPPVGARIMDLQHPTAKMSKSAESPQGTLLLLDDPKAIAKRIKSRGHRLRQRGALRPRRRSPASRTCCRSSRGHRPAAPIADVEAEYAGRGYGALKGAVADAVVEFVRPLQAALRGARAPIPPRSTRILAVGRRRAPRRSRGTGHGARARRRRSPAARGS